VRYKGKRYTQGHGANMCGVHFCLAADDKSDVGPTRQCSTDLFCH